MGLEDLTGSSKYIDDLVVTNPVGATDAKSAGDDHIRGIKNVLKNSFPGVTGAVTATHTELNLLDGATSGAVMLTGRKLVFYESSAPTGWTQDTAVNDKVLRVTSSTGGGSGGSWTISGISVDSHILTEAELPAHTHDSGTLATASDGAHTHTEDGIESDPGFGSIRAGDDFALRTAQNTSSAGAHTHTITGATASAGGGSGHGHDLTVGSLWRPAYYDVIICTKD